MGDYPHSKLLQVGLGLLICGSGLHVGTAVLAGLELWPDPNSNPIDPGSLAALTFWSWIICSDIAIRRVGRHRYTPS